MAEEVSQEMADWDPMAEDYHCLAFNSYTGTQIAAYLPVRSLRQRPDSGHNLKLCIEGFPSDLTETGLKNFLKGIGCRFSAVKVLRNKLKAKKTIGFADFMTTKDAEHAIQLIKSQNTFKLFVCFVTTEDEAILREDLMDKEFEEFAAKLYNQNNEMRVNGEIRSEEEPKVFNRYKSSRFRCKDSDNK